MTAGRLAGRVAIVTGSGDGIGRGIARRFAAEGASIVVAEFNVEKGESAATELRDEFGVEAAFISTDVREKSQAEAMVAFAVSRFGRLDILVNNAWAGRGLKRLESKSDEDMANGMALTLWAGFWAMKAAFPHMKANGWGRIINMCSLNGVNAHMYSADYNAGKEALRALTRTAAREWAPFGICANIICPAAESAAYRTFKAGNPEIAAGIAAQNPMGRVGDAEADIAPVAVFLASEDCRYVTGNTLFVDGGAHINGVAWTPAPEE